MLDIEDRVCETHGEYKAMRYKFGWIGCAQCQEEKQRAEQEEQQRQQQAEWAQRRLQNIFDRAAIPTRFADRTLDAYKAELPGQAKALKVCRDYVTAFDAGAGTSLIFVGGVGAGKTHLAVGIAKELMQRHMTALFMSVMGAVRSVKETYRRDSDTSEREAIANLIEPDLLILDEVGVQFGSDTEKMILFEIINGRYENRRSTIVISNLAIEPLTEYLGERVVDRLREDGGRMVVFDWPSYRRQAA
ncbi:MAG TPA: ATP-binding protein [Burkholderiaceae bacterium]|nr:ATP-binding protein [Burkholderiaceae bacterium]